MEDGVERRPLTAAKLVTADELAERWQVDRSLVYRQEFAIANSSCLAGQGRVTASGEAGQGGPVQG